MMEKRLWQGIILEAVIDIKNPSRKKHKQKALDWIFAGKDKSDFETICTCADLDPEWVRSGIRRVDLNEGAIGGIINTHKPGNAYGDNS